jgi:hypothetical protein
MLGVSNPALKFAIWLLMMDSCFLTHDNVTQKGITFLMIPVQKKGTDVQMVMPMLFWNPPCRQLIDVKSVEDDFIGRTMTNLQLVSHFIDSLSPVVES